MAISQSIEYAKLKDLSLDPSNPRLGRRAVEEQFSQNKILEVMRDWTLEEIAVSFAESGFWTQEALVVVKETLAGKKRMVVVEGNRRLAALQLLAQAKSGNPLNDKWDGIASSISDTGWLELQKVPYVEAGSRSEVLAYLGFRHVTGIKEWEPAEKAEFIARLINDDGLTYEQVRKRIGSKMPSVRQNYLSYRILLQMEQRDDIAIDKVEDRFSVLYLSLRTRGVQKYLQIDIEASTRRALKPVPRSKLRELSNFALWLFGDDARAPIVRDSRYTDKFGQILESSKAVKYLEETQKPSFDTAFRIAGGAAAQAAQHLEEASYATEEALKTVHLHKTSLRVKSAVEHLGKDVLQLLNVFPAIRDELMAEEE